MQPSTLIQLVRNFASIHGPDLSETLFLNLSAVSRAEILEHFATWNQLRAAAGLSPANFRSPTTEADVRSAFRKALKKHGSRLTLKTFRTEAGLSERVIGSRCGSWTRLRLSAGLPSRANARQPAPAPSPPPATKDRITREQILDRFRAEIARHGDNLSLQRFRQLTGFSERLIVSRFGSWSNLRRAAGLAPHAKITPRLTRDQLLDDLLHVYHRTGTDPKMHSYRCYGGQISTVTIRAHFGSWPNAIAALHQHRLSPSASAARSVP